MSVSKITTEELVDLASEAEAGTGPDRELDARIAVAILLSQLVQNWLPRSADVDVQPVTASVDAAFELLQEALPGWRITTGVMDHGFGLTHAAVGESYEAPEDWSHGRAPTLPRAIVAAVLRAVAARGEGP